MVSTLFITTAIPVLHLQAVDVANLEYVQDYIRVVENIGNQTYDNVEKRYLKLEAFKYRMNIYMLRLGMYTDHKKSNADIDRSVDAKIAMLKQSITIIDVAIYFLEKSLSPFNMDSQFVHKCSLDDMDAMNYGGKTSDVYVDDDMTITPLHQEQRARLLGVVESLMNQSIYVLANYSQNYNEQLLEILRRAQNADLQLQMRHRRFHSIAVENDRVRGSISDSVLNNLININVANFNSLKESYIQLLENTKGNMSKIFDESSTSNPVHANIIEEDIRALDSEIERIKNFDHSKLNDATINDESVKNARNWIIREYIREMDEFITTNNANLDTLVSESTHNLSSLQSDIRNHTLFPISVALQDYAPIQYTEYLELMKSEFIGSNAYKQQPIIGMHMRTFDIIPIHYLYIKSESTNILEALRNLDRIFQNKSNKTYVVVIFLIMWLRHGYNEWMAAKLVPNSTVEQDPFIHLKNKIVIPYVETWIKEGGKGIRNKIQTINIIFRKLSNIVELNSIQADMLAHESYLKSKKSPLFIIFQEIHAKGDIVYYNTMAMLKDRMYDQINSISEYHKNAFYDIHKGIVCLRKYTQNMNATFALVRCLVRIRFLKPDHGEFTKVVRAMWTCITNICRQSWTSNNVEKFKTKFGPNIYHILNEVLDLIESDGMRLLSTRSFYNCCQYIEYIPFEVVNVLIDLMYVINKTSIQYAKQFDVLCAFRNIDEKISVCEKAREVFEWVKTELLRDDEDAPPQAIPTLSQECMSNPNVLNDVQNLIRDIKAYVPRISDRDILLSHIPGRYDLVYSDYRYAYLPRELKNIFDDAYFYLNLSSENENKVLGVFDRIAQTARGIDTGQDSRPIYDYLAGKYKQCVLLLEDGINPLILLYKIITDVVDNAYSFTLRLHVFERYITNMTALYPYLKNPYQVVGVRSYSVIRFEAFFQPNTVTRAIGQVRRLVTLPLLTEYPEINVYNQRHILHYAWKYLRSADIQNPDTGTMRTILNDIAPYTGDGSDVTLNTFVHCVVNLQSLIEPNSSANWNYYENVLLLVYDNCELKTLYTRTPLQTMVYPAEFKQLLIEYENSQNIYRCRTISTRYFAGIYTVFKNITRGTIQMTLEAEKLRLSIQKYDRIYKWPMPLIYQLATKINEVQDDMERYAHLTSVGVNHLVYIFHTKIIGSEPIYEITNYLNKYIRIKQPTFLDYLNPRMIDNFDLHLKIGESILSMFAKDIDTYIIQNIPNAENTLADLIKHFHMLSLQSVDLLMNILTQIDPRHAIQLLKYTYQAMLINMSLTSLKCLRTEFLNRQDWLVSYLKLILETATNHGVIINTALINSLQAKEDIYNVRTKKESIRAKNYKIVQNTVDIFNTRFIMMQRFIAVADNWITIVNRFNPNTAYIYQHHEYFNRHPVDIYKVYLIGLNEVLTKAIQETDLHNNFIIMEPFPDFSNYR
uniref:Uncharacterized protein n=2 Tax=Ixodes ricinus TaxID=34613 RepID=V5GMP8_IXORI